MAVYKRGKTFWISFIYQGERFQLSADTDSRKVASRRESQLRRELTDLEGIGDFPTFMKAVRITKERLLEERKKENECLELAKKQLKQATQLVLNRQAYLSQRRELQTVTSLQPL